MKTRIISIAALTIVALSAEAATNQFSVTASGSQNYTINGVSDPTDITLVRGFTYFFNISVMASHPFYIKTISGTGTGNSYNDGVSAQGLTSGTVEFSVPTNAPDTLFYQCSNHNNMTGPLHIIDSPAVSIVDFGIGTNVVLRSTGTEALNLRIQTRSSLTNTWSASTIQLYSFSGGTNTTHIALPAGNATFFRVQQGFF